MTEGITTDKPRRDWYSIFLSVISLALAVLVVLLVVQNRQLKQQLSAGPAAAPMGSLPPGETLSTFTLASATGEPVQVPVGDGRRRLLVVFTSTCPHCRDAMPIWRDLVAGGHGAEVVGLQLDAGSAGAKPIDTLPFPVLTPGTSPPPFLQKLGGVPVSILVDGSGKIERVVYGPPAKKDLAALRDAMHG